MRFNEIVGLTATKANLIATWNRGRMPHALLLLGPEGAGGLPLALALAQFILCEDKQVQDACGACANCKKVQRLEHADLHFSYPGITIANKPSLSRNFSKEFRNFVQQTPYGSVLDWLQAISAEKKMGNLSADECREIIEQLNLKSYEGGVKIQLIWMPEYLGKNGNILLKIIEEPPPGTYIILVAEDEAAILPTILSRLQLVRVPALSPNEIAVALQDRGLATGNKALQIGQIANGSFAEALRLVDDFTNDLLPLVKNLFNALFTGNGIGVTRFSEEWAKAGRENISNVLEYTQSLLEGSLRLRYLPQSSANYAPEEAEFLTKLAARNLPEPCYTQMITALTEATRAIRQNANAKAILTAMGIKLIRVIRQLKA